MFHKAAPTLRRQHFSLRTVRSRSTLARYAPSAMTAGKVTMAIVLVFIIGEYSHHRIWTKFGMLMFGQIWDSHRIWTKFGMLMFGQIWDSHRIWTKFGMLMLGQIWDSHRIWTKFGMLMLGKIWDSHRIWTKFGMLMLGQIWDSHRIWTKFGMLMLGQIWDYHGLAFQNHGKNQKKTFSSTPRDDRRKIASTSTDSSLQRCSKEGLCSCGILKNRNVGE